MKTQIALISLVSLGLVFIATDCFCGRTRFHECMVVGHRYIPDTSHYNYDSDGHPTWVSEPEQWHVDCFNLESTKILDCNTSQTKYYAVTNNEHVTVQTRQGRFTGWQWYPRLDL